MALGLATVGAVSGTTPEVASAASCVRIVGGNFDAYGNDNYSQYLNGEYVTLRNYCSSSRSMTGYRITDYGTTHTYYFPSGYSIGPGYNVKLHSGRGTNSKYNIYWQRSYGAVWNNAPPERAYLRTSSGTIVSSWSEY